MKKNKRSSRGISLISLVITIIVVIILAAIVISNLSNSTDAAKKARFFHDMSTLDDGVHLAYTSKYVHNPDISREEAIPNKGALSDKEKNEIRKVPTLEKSIKLVTGVEDVTTRKLYWLDTDGIEAEVTNKKDRFIIDMENLVIYDYDGKYFFEERWHTIRFGLSDSKNDGNGDDNNEDLDEGWLRLVLNYPERSTNRQYRVASPGEIRNDPNLEWTDYTGPILIKIWQTKYVWIRYNLDGKDVIEAPEGTLLVYIKPDKEPPEKAESIKVTIDYDEEAEVKEYKVGNSGWQEYKGEFIVTKNVTIKARAYKTIIEKDENGNIVNVIQENGTDQYKITNIDDKEIDETLEAPKLTRQEAQSQEEKARVSIEYPEHAKRMIYLVNSGEERTYEEIISVKEWGEEITAYYYTEDGRKSKEASIIIRENEDKLDVDIYVIPEPQVEKSATEVTVMIEYDDRAITKQYQINDSEIKEYTEPIKVRENCKITAYATSSEGYRGDATRDIKFAEKEITEPEIIETLNQDRTEAKIKIKYPENAVKKEYMIIDKDGNESELMEYDGEFSVTEDGTTIYAVATSALGDKKDATHTVYLNMVRPVITVEVNSNKTEAKVGISYDSTAIRKEYKIVDENRNEIKGLTSYTGQFIVKENRVYVIAEEENQNGVVVTEEAFIQLDMSSPVITGEVSIKNGAKVATISIEYDRGSISKKYKIINASGEESELLDYQESFDITESGTIIYAVGRNERGEEKDATYTVKIGLDDALINQRIEVDTNNNEVAKVSIVYDPNSIVKKYRVDGGEWLEYSGEFVVTKHLSNVETLSINTAGEERINKKKIEIPVKEPTVSFEIDQEDKTKAIVTIIYDEHANKREYTIDEGLGEGKIQLEYTGPVIVKVNGTKIKGINSNMAGDQKESKEVVVSGIEEEAGIRFIEPIINGMQIDEKMNIDITYSEGSVRKEYKIITPNGEESEFKTYEGSFDVTENGTVIYAEAENEEGIIKGSTYTVDGIIRNIPVEIIANPENEVVEEVRISINYGEGATRKTYRISGEEEKEYTGEFVVNRNCTITAIATGENARGEATKNINNLSNGIKVPVINVVKKEGTEGEYADVTIEYDEASVNKVYVINDEEEINYTGVFSVKENGTKIKAIAIDKYGNIQYATKTINLTKKENIKDAMKKPSIVSDIIETSEGKVAEVTIYYPNISVTKTYKIDDGEEINYEEEFIVKKHGTKVTAISRNSDGTVTTAEEIIDINGEDLNDSKIKVIPRDGYLIVELTYPKNTTNRRYKFEQNDWKQYPGIRGFALIEDAHKEEVLKNNEDVRLYKTSRSIYSYKEHYYIYDGVIDTEVIEMIWDSKKDPKEKPNLFPLQPSPKEKVDIVAVYPEGTVKKEYKIGSSGEWKEYTGPITVTKNYTYVYARATFTDGSTTQNSYYVKNLQIPIPEGDIDITYTPTGPAKEVEVTIKYNPSTSGLINRYKIGTGNWITSQENEVKFKVNKNTTIYSSFSNEQGQTSGAITLKITNIDNKAPLISISYPSGAQGLKSLYNITISDGSTGSGIDFEKCRYIYNKSSEAYLEDDPIWDSAKGGFTTSPQTLEVEALEGSGEYYIHVLAVDRAGNKAVKNLTTHRTVDIDPPLDATIILDKESALPSDIVTAKVTMNDNEGGSKINIEASRYIFSSASGKYGVDNSIWNTASYFTKTSTTTVEPLKLQVNNEGIYYLHVLSVDNMGNKTETVSNKVEVKTISYITAADIDSEPSKYYGTYVNYSPLNGCPEKWRIFYADKSLDRIYLIIENYALSNYMGDIPGMKYNKSHVYYRESTSIKVPEMLDNMKNPSNFTRWLDAEGKAESAIASTTLEMLVKSWNKRYPSAVLDFDYCQKPTTVKLNEDNSLYLISENYFLTTAEMQNSGTLSKVYGKKVSSEFNSIGRLTTTIGARLRPVVTLKAGTVLILNDDGTLSIK